MTVTMLFPLYIVNFLLKNRVRFFLRVMLHGDAERGVLLNAALLLKGAC